MAINTTTQSELLSSETKVFGIELEKSSNESLLSKFKKNQAFFFDIEGTDQKCIVTSITQKKHDHFQFYALLMHKDQKYSPEMKHTHHADFFVKKKTLLLQKKLN